MIEVTDEMMAAGVDALGEVANKRLVGPRDVVVQVYWAMVAARPVLSVEITEAIVDAASKVYRDTAWPTMYHRDRVRAILTAALAGRDVPLLTFDQARAIGEMVHDRFAAMAGNAPLDRDDVGWGDIVQFVVRHARSIQSGYHLKGDEK